MTDEDVPRKAATWKLRKQQQTVLPRSPYRWVLYRKSTLSVNQEEPSYLVWGRYYSMWGALEDLAMEMGYDRMFLRNRRIMMGFPPDPQEGHVI